jgi:hypothetical protein
MGSDEFIAASRTYGRVDEHDGEYVETEFTCLGWLRIPLLPVRSFWIADDRGRERAGFPIKLHPRSVVAAYLRIWAPAVAVAMIVLGSSSFATVIAACLFGLSAWSWTWWPRDAAVRRSADFDLAAFGSRCDPARMTDAMHQALADQLRLRVGADPRPPDDIVRFGARTVAEALLVYGLSRLTDARRPPPSGPRDHLRGAAQMLGSVVRRRRPRGGPYRDRPEANSPELWTMLSTAAQDSARDRRAGPLRSYHPVPAPGLVLPSSYRKPWLWFAVLVVSTIASGVALHSSSPQHLGPRALVERKPSPPPATSRRGSVVELARQAPPEPPDPRPPPDKLRRRSGDELTYRPIGEHIAVLCDYVQNSDRGRLRHVSLCLVGTRILAVAGGNLRHDNGRLLHGYVEEIPWSGRTWAKALHEQVRADPRYYDFYLRRISYGDDTPDNVSDEADSWNNAPVSAHFDDHGGDDRIGGDRADDRRAGDGHTHEALIRAMALAASLATLAGWLVWIRLWQLRRRVARWVIAE